MFRKIRFTVLLVILCLCLTGCENSYERLSDTENTLYIGEVASSFPTTYMPWFSRDGIAPTISSMVFSTLLSYDEDTDTYSSLLAEEWAYLAPDGTSLMNADGTVDWASLESAYASPAYSSMILRFKLSENAYWSDGEKVTVKDIYFTFDLAANQKLSNHAGALAWVGDLMHKYDTNSGKLRRQGIWTWDTGANEHGFPIAENEKDTVFYMEVSKVLGGMATLVSTVLILPEHIYAPIISYDNPLNNTSPEGELAYAYRHPVGCGAYILDTDKTNAQEIVLRRRQDYFMHDDDGGDYYKVDTLKFILYQDVNVAIYSLKKGHIDVLDTSISGNYVSLFEKDKDIVVINAPGTYAKCLVLNVNVPSEHSTVRREQLKDVEVRRAISLAIDQEALIAFCLNGNGNTISPGLIPENNADLYNKETELNKASVQDRLLEANQILDQIFPDKDKDGYRQDDCGRISFVILASPGDQDTVAYLQVLFQKIGIEVNYAPYGSSPENTYLYGGDFDMTLQSVILNTSNIDIMYNSHFVTMGKSSNYGRLNVREITAAIAKMRSTLNRDTKFDMIKDIELQIAEQYYKLPLFTSNVISVARTDRFYNWAQKDGSLAFSTDSLRQLKRTAEGGYAR